MVNHQDGEGFYGNLVNDYGDYQMRMDLTAFNGYMHIVGFLDWLSKVEKFFGFIKLRR